MFESQPSGAGARDCRQASIIGAGVVHSADLTGCSSSASLAPPRTPQRGDANAKEICEAPHTCGRDDTIFADGSDKNEAVVKILANADPEMVISALTVGF